MDPSEYLKTFAELDRLRPVPVWGRPHARTCGKDAFHVFLSVGDARESLRFDEMDPNPIRMAAAVIAKWRTTPGPELLVVD